MRPRPSSEEERLQRALEGHPDWVMAIWATPVRRLAFSAAWLALAAWILIYALTDPAGYFDGRHAVAGFVAAPALALMFGLQFLESARDLARGRNSVPVLIRLGRWLDRRGMALMLAYVVLMVLLLVLWR